MAATAKPRVRRLLRSSFEARLTGLIVLLLLGVKALDLVLATTLLKQNMERVATEQVVANADLFGRFLAEMTRRNAESARILSLDVGFRETIAAGDPEAMAGALRNLARRIGADQALLFDLEGKVVTTVAEGEPPDLRLDADLRTQAIDKGEATLLAHGDDTLSRLVIVPVMAPDPIAFIGMGFAVDDALARRLRKLTSMDVDVLFLHRAGDGDDWRAVASTVTEATARGRVAALAPLRFRAGTLEIGDQRFVSLATPVGLPTTGGELAMAMQISVEVATEPFEPVLATLSAVVVVVLGLGVAGCVLIARGLSRPVRALAAAAQRIRAGQYGQKVPVEAKDEIGRLAEAFNDMMDGIAEREALISYQARYDGLTDLPNRDHFEEMLEQAMHAARDSESSLSVVIVDLPDLPEIANTLGRATGDRVLQLAAARLESALGRGLKAGHIGDRSLAVLLADGSTDEALRIAETLVRTFERPFELDDLSIDCPAACGVARYPADGASARDLLQHADVAANLARAEDRKVAAYDAARDPYTRERLGLMGALRSGLARGEFELHFQPKLNLRTGRVTAAEALIRWHSPTYGRLPPDRFLPLAERTGNIQRVTAWVLREAVARCAEWQNAGHDIGIAVNVSAKDLNSHALPPLIASLLQRHGLAPASLTVEITESALFQDADRALTVLRALRDLGLTLSVDDYGTGYSSMSYLKRLPVQELKIDRSFVRDLTHSREDEIICRSTIEMGHALGLTITAEGVEEMAAVESLRSLGCDAVQGYLIAKPLPLTDFLTFLERSPWAGRGAPRDGAAAARPADLQPAEPPMRVISGGRA